MPASRVEGEQPTASAPSAGYTYAPLVHSSKATDEAEGGHVILTSVPPTNEAPGSDVEHDGKLLLGSVCGGTVKNQLLLRTWSGKAVSKRMFVDALKEYAGLTGSEDIARITGRSMRVTGAQMMRLAGFDVEQVKLLGRWQNTAQGLCYLRDSVTKCDLSEKVTKSITAPTAVQAKQVKSEFGLSAATPRSSKRWNKLRGHRR